MFKRLTRLLSCLLFFTLFATASAETNEEVFSLYQNKRYVEAFPKLLALAESGNPRAAGLTARMYVNGLGVKQDVNLAFRWGYQAAKSGDPLAQNLLGVLYKNGWGTSQSLSEAILWFRKSAEQDFNLAYQNLGDVYFYGQGITRDIAQARLWYERAAMSDNRYAKYMAGVSVDDEAKSFAYMKAAADLGYTDAYASLGDFYYHGKVVSKDFSQAKALYERVANTTARNAKHAKRMLGSMYFGGEGLPKDIDRAIELYKQAAELGDIWSINNLGRIYDNGIEVTENPQLSFNYYEQSAKLGDQIGLTYTAINLLNGVGSEKDRKRAREYFRQSADKGNIFARLYLLDIEIEEGRRNQLSPAIIDAKKLAAKHRAEFPASSSYIAADRSELTKKIKEALNKETNKFDVNAKIPFILDHEVLAESMALVQQVDLALADIREEIGAREKADFLRFQRYAIEYRYGGLLFIDREATESEELRLARDIQGKKWWADLFKFSDQILADYPEQHIFHVWALHYKMDALLSGRLDGFQNRKQLVNEVLGKLLKPSSLLPGLAASEQTDNSVCEYYKGYLTRITYYQGFLSRGESKELRDEIISQITSRLEQAISCLATEDMNFAKGMIYGLTKPSEYIDGRFQAYLVGRIGNNDADHQALIAGLSGNQKRRERILRDQYGEAITGEPSIMLLDYYLRDGDVERAEKSLRASLVEAIERASSSDQSASRLGGLMGSLGGKFSFSKLARIPSISRSQRVFLLKMAVAEDREANFGLQQLVDNELFNFNFHDQETERTLIAELFNQGRNIEAELVLRYVKAIEMREILRNSAIQDTFVLPDWFFTPYESALNNKYLRYLDDALKIAKAEARAEKLRNPDLTNAANKLFDFLIQGERDEKIAARKPKVYKADDRIGGLMKSLPLGTGLLQYLLLNDKLIVNLNFKGGKITKQVALQDVSIESLIYNFRVSLANKEDVKISGFKLYTLLFGAIEPELSKRGIKHVMISADGRLRYVPFSALWDGSTYLLNRYTFSVFDEIGNFDYTKQEKGQINIAGFGVSKSISGFLPLPAVEGELKRIILNSTGGLFPGKIFMNQDFTVDSFQTALKKQYPFVHVATHFRFSAGTEENSFLLLGDGSRLNLLALSGISLKGVELITYSGCQTGLGGGRDEKGKEIAGLTYISLRNGARSVIASLWSVSDQSTSELMVRMYGARAKSGSSKAAALQEATREMAKSERFSHPFHWAGFQLHGNWQ
jgi:CHAT domain-containing protein/TPR repeat protein